MRSQRTSTADVSECLSYKKRKRSTNADGCEGEATKLTKKNWNVKKQQIIEMNGN